MSQPHRCPLCQDRDIPEEACPACGGKGIVWEPEPERPVPVIPVHTVDPRNH